MPFELSSLEIQHQDCFCDRWEETVVAREGANVNEVALLAAYMESTTGVLYISDKGLHWTVRIIALGTI